jgi:hypothetical protein
VPHDPPDNHRFDQPVPVEVEQDGAWWPGLLYARTQIDGEWWGWVDRHVDDAQHRSAVPYSRISLCGQPREE